MSKKVLTVGIVLVLGILVIGALAMWVLPDRAEARYNGGRGFANNQTGCAAQGDCVGAGYRGGNGQAGNGMPGRQGTGPVDGCLLSDGPAGTLSESEANALRTALADEYTAKALYAQAMADLGSVRPFFGIERAEERHIATLERMFEAYGMDIPSAPAGTQEGTFATLADACAAGVSVETANAALYGQLLAQVENPNLIRVFTALQSASQTRHLPALEACAQ
jgi:hypothetical protein